MWKPFNYTDYEEGLFWLLQMSPVHDCDLSQSGEMVGEPTGDTRISSVLAWVETGIDNVPLFSPVDPQNHGRIDNDGFITHFCEVTSPAHGLQVSEQTDLAQKEIIADPENHIDFRLANGAVIRVCADIDGKLKLNAISNGTKLCVEPLNRNSIAVIGQQRS